MGYVTTTLRSRRCPTLIIPPFYTLFHPQTARDDPPLFFKGYNPSRPVDSDERVTVIVSRAACVHTKIRDVSVG